VLLRICVWGSFYFIISVFVVDFMVWIFYLQIGTREKVSMEESEKKSYHYFNNNIIILLWFKYVCTSYLCFLFVSAATYGESSDYLGDFGIVSIWKCFQKIVWMLTWYDCVKTFRLICVSNEMSWILSLLVALFISWLCLGFCEFLEKWSWAMINEMVWCLGVFFFFF